MLQVSINDSVTRSYWRLGVNGLAIAVSTAFRHQDAGVQALFRIVKGSNFQKYA